MASKAAMDDNKLPSHFASHGMVRPRRRNTIHTLFLGTLAFVFLSLTFYTQHQRSPSSNIPIHASETLHKCRHLHTKPGPPPDFNFREESDRFEPGTRATLLRNATIWTGGINGLEIVKGDMLLDRGLIKAVGRIGPGVLQKYKTDLVTLELDEAWVTPGYVRNLSQGLAFNSLSRQPGLLTFIHT